MLPVSGPSVPARVDLHDFYSSAIDDYSDFDKVTACLFSVCSYFLKSCRRKGPWP
jgi:hypothetical protein